MSYRIVRGIRTAWKLVALAGAALFLVGFVAQLREFRRFPWAWSALSYTAPVTELMHDYVPTVFGGLDTALLVALVPLGIVYVILDRGLQSVEGVVRARVSAAKLRPRGAASPRGDGRTAAPAAASGAAQPSYQTEALVVIDLVKSSEMVTRFGNSFFFTLKQQMERYVTPIAASHAVSFTKDTGDGFLLCFPSIVNALETVKEIIEAVPLMNRELPHGAEAALRAAVGFGEVIVQRRDGDRTGSAVHKTFRLQAIGPANVTEAEGGVSRDEVPQKNCVFISEEAASGITAPSFSCRFLGLAEFKGFPGLHRIYQLQWR